MPTLQTLLRRRFATGRRTLRRAPRQPFPVSEQREYLRDLLPILETLQDLVERHLIAPLPSWARQAQANRPTLDAWDDDVRRSMAFVRVEFERRWTDEELGRLARRRGLSLSALNRRGVLQQFRAVLGVDPFLAEPWLRSELEAFVTQNVALIRTLPERLFSDLEQRIFTSLRAGQRWEELAQDLRARIGVTRSNLERIARDQISKLNGQLTMLRQTQLGVREYIWETAADERVRASHAARDGRVFRWSDPPGDLSDPGDGGHPGQAIHCRCIALPVIVSALEPGAEED